MGYVFVGSNIKPHFAPCFSSTNYVFALTQRWQEATGLQEDWRVRLEVVNGAQDLRKCTYYYCIHFERDETVQYLIF